MLYEEIKITDESSLPKDPGEYIIKIRHSGVFIKHTYSGSDLSKEGFFGSVESYLLPVPAVTIEQATKEAEELYPFLDNKTEPDWQFDFNQKQSRAAYIAGRMAGHNGEK